MAKTFHQLSPRAQTAIFVLLCIVTVGAGWQVLISPEREELASRESRLDDIKSQLTAAQATAKKLDVVRREVAAMELALKQSTAVLPDEKDPQEVLRNLHEMAMDTALDISIFTPKAIATKAQYAEWPIELGLEGNFHDLGRFFDRVASTSRLISVSDLHLKTKTRPDGRGNITASCITTTFVFKKDMAPPAAGTGSGPASGGSK